MTITLKVSEETKEKMIEYFEDKKREKTPAYAVFQADEADTVVTLYESGKVVFQGVSADIDANIWKTWEKKLNPGKVIEENKKKDKEKKEIVIDPKIYNSTSIVSDEVGTGDYFGPIVVTAALVKKEDIPFLEELGVKDSKKMDDTKILEVVPKIIERINYSSIILTNKEYNETYNENFNMNKIKAILHNNVLYKLMQEEKPEIDYIVVDEFAREARYYEYLSGTNVVQRNITFMTKAEDKNLAVACGSIISRYLFLKEFDKICDTIHIPLPKGAGKDVDTIGEEVVEKYGKEKLNEIAKVNFKNTDRILHTMIY